MTDKQVVLGWADDGYGEDVTPPEPGKRWITIGYLDENGYLDGEIAVLVNRKGEPRPDQIEWAKKIVEAVNNHESLLSALKIALGIIEAENLDEKYDGESEVIRHAIIKGGEYPCCDHCTSLVLDGGVAGCGAPHYIPCDVSDCQG